MRLTAWLCAPMLAYATGAAASDASDYLEQAIKLMEESPLIDTHIDLPQIFRSLRKSRPLFIY